MRALEKYFTKWSKIICVFSFSLYWATDSEKLSFVLNIALGTVNWITPNNFSRIPNLIGAEIRGILVFMSIDESYSSEAFERTGPICFVDFKVSWTIPDIRRFTHSVSVYFRARFSSSGFIKKISHFSVPSSNLTASCACVTQLVRSLCKNILYQCFMSVVYWNSMNKIRKYAVILTLLFDIFFISVDLHHSR